jgi:hypothetical protein
VSAVSPVFAGFRWSRLDRAKVRIDLDQLDQLLTSTDADNEPDLEAALALWRGEPLEGADYIWADAHIHRLRATLLGLLERAGHARLERDDARGALHRQSRSSHSTSSTRPPGAWRCKPNTRSGCASPSRAATTTSPARSMSSLGFSPRARRGSCTANCSGRPDMARPMQESGASARRQNIECPYGRTNVQGAM